MRHSDHMMAVVNHVTKPRSRQDTIDMLVEETLETNCTLVGLSFQHVNFRILTSIATHPFVPLDRSLRRKADNTDHFVQLKCGRSNIE